MLVLFRFKNFGPFKEEAVFDMRAVKSYKEHPYNLIQEENGDALVKVAAIYGANASGKSHFVAAYNCFCDVVKTSFRNKGKDTNELSPLEELYDPFFFNDESNDGDTEFEAVYHDAGMEYRYGFVYNKSSIVEEWLYKTSLKTNRQIVIFERDSKEIRLGPSVKKSCEKYLDDIDTDVLALSFFSSLKLRNDIFRHLSFCITIILAISFSEEAYTESALRLYFSTVFNEEEKVRLLRFLGAIDVGIKDVQVEKDNNKIEVYTTHLGKDNKEYNLSIQLESDGTRKAIAIYSLAQIAVKYGGCLIVDEFNSQLHPLLQKYLIDLFYEDSSTAQLIYTTHDTNMLDRKYMRRDQIWFVNKDEFGEASLYSLAEFKIRNDKSFENDYLSGVYGGIPILKDFSFKED